MASAVGRIPHRSWACSLVHWRVCSGAWMHAAVCSKRSPTLLQIGSWISLTTPSPASRNHCYWARNVTRHLQIYLLHFVVVLNDLRMHMHWFRWWGFLALVQYSNVCIELHGVICILYRGLLCTTRCTPSIVQILSGRLTMLQSFLILCISIILINT